MSNIEIDRRQFMRLAGAAVATAVLPTQQNLGCKFNIPGNTPVPVSPSDELTTYDVVKEMNQGAIIILTASLVGLVSFLVYMETIGKARRNERRRK